MAADLGVRGFPQKGNLPQDQRVGLFAPVRGLCLARINVLPPFAGVSEFWSLLLHLEEGLQRSKNRNSRRFDLAGQSLPREPDWTGAEVSHKRTLGRALFFSTSITQTYWNSSSASFGNDLDDLVPYQKRDTQECPST